MSYKNDHLLVILNRYGKASGDAKVVLYETYDKLIDLTVGGTQTNGTGLGGSSSFLVNLARLIAPSSFMSALGSDQINIPGTSYSSSLSGSNAIVSGGTASFGYGDLGNYKGFPTGGAAGLGSLLSSLSYGIGSYYSSSLANDFVVGGKITGAAASLVSAPTLTSTSSKVNTAGNIVIPIAGIVAGIGGIAQNLSPYLGPYGLATSAAGGILAGISSTVAAGYQRVSTQILNNADTILSQKVRNIETVVKMLDTQSDIVKKMLKESMEGDSKAIQDL